MKGWRFFFLAAGLFNVIGGTVGFLTAPSQLDPAPVYPFAFRLLLIFVIIMGIAYLMVARSPQDHRDLVLIGLMTKVAGLVMSFWAISDGQLPVSSWWQPVINDLPWAIGFALFLLRTRSSKESS